jgi:hypothetical protein
MKRLLPVLIAIALLSLVYMSVHPALSKATGKWQRVGQAAPAALVRQLRQDYAPYLRLDTPIDVGQMQVLKLQQPGALPLYVINTRVHTQGKPEMTPSCGMSGCLLLGYIPQNAGFKQVLKASINDFQVQGAPPVVRSIERVLNHVPCFGLTTFNPSTQRVNPTQTLCFDGHQFVRAENRTEGSFHP